MTNLLQRVTFLGLAVLLSAATGLGPALAQAPSRPAPPAVARPDAPARPAMPAPAGPVADGKRVDLNSAPESELDTLPGIGPARAKAIVANRPYATLEEVSGKASVPAGVVSAIAGRVALANINTASARDLQRTLPGIGDVRAGQIVAGRPYAAPGDLVSKGVLTQALFDRIKDLVTY